MTIASISISDIITADADSVLINRFGIPVCKNKIPARVQQGGIVQTGYKSCHARHDSS